jgi:hypothetical protein
MNELRPETETLVEAQRGPESRDAGAVSWGAVLAGGVGAAAFSLILLTLGTGLGLAAVSPWRPSSTSAKAFGFAAIAWVCVTQIMASGMGGYLAGRLRRRWPFAEADEVYFRDTAHGFLSWSVATLAMAVLFAAAIPASLSGGGRLAASATGEAAIVTRATIFLERGNAQALFRTWPIGYFVDSLFREPAGAPNVPVPTTRDDALKIEVTRIFANSLASGDPLPDEDAAYVSRLVARQTGFAEGAALARVKATYSNLEQKINALDTAARVAADAARKATIFASLWLFVALLMGAFVASLSATYGGRVRDT